MKKIPFIVVVALLCTVFLSHCGTGINLFSVDDDKRLGANLAAEIESMPEEFPVLSPTEYPEAYAYLLNIRNRILNSGAVQFKDEFEWQVRIIHDDDVLNAFAAPGGFMYFYTGLIHFLDEEDHLAGVFGHEVAHADRRHATESLTREFGISLLLEAVLGVDPNLLVNIARSLTSLSFSRENEADADTFSIKYLAPTVYACNGAAGFFQKILDEEEGSRPPEFLSTHPSPDSRVADINAQSVTEGCSTDSSGINYQQFKDLLP